MRESDQVGGIGWNGVMGNGEDKGGRTDVEVLLRASLYMRGVEFGGELLALLCWDLSGRSVRKSEGVGERVERNDGSKSTAHADVGEGGVGEDAYLFC